MLIDHLLTGMVMRYFARWITAGAVLAAAVAACSVPTDKSQDIQVIVRQSATLAARGILPKGTRDSLSAFAFRVSATGDTQPLSNVELRWSPSDPQVAIIEGGASGRAIVTGLNDGYVTVIASPVAFDQANPGTTLIRVASGFVVDSIRPRSVRYGEKIDVYGVGIHLPFLWFLGGAELIDDPFAFTGNFAGLEKREFWVPPPASSGRPFFIGGGLADSAAELITVTREDIFEPDTATPGAININGAGSQRLLGGLRVLFFNPALAFEPVSTGSSDIDWDRFDQSDLQPASILVNSQVFGDTAFAYVSDSLLKCGPQPTDICYQPPGWFFTAGFQVCNNTSFSYLQPRVPTFIVAFKKWPTPRLHLAQFYAKEGRYALAVVRGYLGGNRDIPPDRFEDNQLCWQADANFQDSTGPARRQIVVGAAAPFGDSLLTISQPYDVDFYRFRVQPPATPADTVLTIQMKSRPLGGVDPSDVDVYLYDPVGNSYASSQNLASDEIVTITGLPAGEYYAIAVDYAGQPTVYSMCIAKAFACSPPGSAPFARVTAKPRPPVPPGAPAPPAGVSPSNPRLLSPRR
jgi:hypothetical protein